MPESSPTERAVDAIESATECHWVTWELYGQHGCACGLTFDGGDLGFHLAEVALAALLADPDLLPSIMGADRERDALVGAVTGIISPAEEALRDLSPDTHGYARYRQTWDALRAALDACVVYRKAETDE